MPRAKQVKIIKRTKRGDSQAARLNRRPANLRDDGEKPKRDAVTIVTEWITEMRRKKAQEAALGFEGLFGKAV